MLLLLLIFAWSMASVVGDCGLYLIPSSILNAGRGIAAGKTYDREVEIESNPTLPIPKVVTQKTQLSHYVYGTGDVKYDMLMFGPASIYNHHQIRNVYYSWKEHAVADPSLSLIPHTNFTPTVFKSTIEISQGAEMFNFYGDHWFDRFGSHHNAESDEQPSVDLTHRFTATDFKQFGHCLTDVTTNLSTISNAGKGLFAAKNFAAEEIVSISPVILLAKSVVEEHIQETVLMNYCITSHDSNVVLFPINYGAMINHNHTEANVKVEWFDWSPAVEALAAKYHPSLSSEKNQNLCLSDMLIMSAKELYTAPFAQLDIAYRATRPIAEGEELLVDYGPAWEAAWSEYVAKMEIWEDEKSNKAQIQERPQFRAYMAAPESLFATHWREEQQCSVDEEEVSEVCAL